MKRAFSILGLLVFSLFRCSNSESLETALSARDPPQPLAPDLVDQIATSPIALVVARDGTISCIHVESGSLLWSYKSGVPTYSSMQASATVGDESEFGMRDDTYIDVGADDGKLYIHDKRKGIKKRLDFGPKDLVSKTPLSANGTTILGQMTTTEIVFDAETGTVIRALSPTGFESQGVDSNTLEKAIVRLKESGIPFPEAGELIIKRIDYAFSAYTEVSGVPLWKLMFSDVKAEYSNRLFSSHCHSKLKDRMSSSCRVTIPVYQIHDTGYWKPPSLIGAPDISYENINTKLLIPELGNFLALRGDTGKVTVLSSDESDSPVMARGFDSLPVESISPVAVGAVAIPVIDTKSVSTIVDINSSPTAWPVAVLLGIFLFILGIVVYYIFLFKGKQNEELKPKAIAQKKKKTRKSVHGKNSNEADKLKGSPKIDSCEEASTLLLYDNNDIRNGYGELRQVGKLYISYKEIAKGSNGTVVLEGIYDGRPVAVKRLVQTHYDVAQKEIQNLIASDQHPNVVRWHGMEYDSDFVYLALERCHCNLNDWVLCCSQSSTNATSDIDLDPAWESEYALQLQQSIRDNNDDFELWRANGYPSVQLLKLMRDVVSGLAHLHELGIIHRDLKPQNILIIKEKSYSAKLSDMGISKRLDVDMTALSQHATGVGSSGWRAPEQLKNGRQTRAVDLFSLGCVLFFCITGGRHPFGNRLERDSNIVNDRKDLFLVENIPEVFDLITRLLDPNPELRPKALQVLQHPLFWNSDTRLSFLRDVSDRVELEDREYNSELLKALESVGSTALGGKWDEKLESSFLVNIARYRRYKYDSVRDLLRVVRNKLNHYRELPSDIQEVLGSVPEGFDFYFTSRFPRLLIEVYKVMYSYCRGEEFLNKYFDSAMI